MLSKRLFLKICAIFLAYLLISVSTVFSATSIEITIKSAKLPTTKPSGSNWDVGVAEVLPDPYVVVYVNDEIVMKTSIEYDSYEPIWNSRVSFSSEFLDDYLEILVFDADIDWGGIGDFPPG